MAGKCVPEDTDDILSCSRCDGVLVDPKTLSCLHSYCNSCLLQLRTVTQDGADGYKCHQCNQVTLKSAVQVIPVLVQLLNATRHIGKEANCNKCETMLAKWHCYDCQKFVLLCDSCKMNHDEFATSFGIEHQVVLLQEQRHSRPVIRNKIYCQEHKDNKIEGYCQQCQKMICFLCKVINHEGHQTELVSDALKRIIQRIEANKEKIEENIKINRKTIATMSSEKGDFTSVKMVPIPTNESQEEKNIIHDAESKDILNAEEFDNKIKAAEYMVMQQTQLLKWYKNSLERITGVSLFHELQNRLLEKFEHMAVDKPFNLDLEKRIKMYASRCLSWDIPCDKEPELEKVTLVPHATGYHSYTRIALLWDKLWLFNTSNGMVVKFNYDCEKSGDFKLDDQVQAPITAIQVSLSMAIVASKSGLYSMDEDGNITDLFYVEGDFSDLCLAEDGKIYALEQNKGMIFVFKKQQLCEVFTKDYTIQLKVNYMASFSDYKNSIVVWNKTIYVAMVVNNPIGGFFVLTYNFKGELENKTGGFYHPSICAVNSNGALLICDYGNQRLCQQKCNDTNPQNLFYPGFYPWYAVFPNKYTVWIIDLQNRLKKYVYK